MLDGMEKTSTMVINALDKASLISKVFFFWVSPMMKKGYSRPLQQGDNLRLPLDLCPKAVFTRFQNALNETKDAGATEKSYKVAVIRAFLRAVGRYFWRAVFLQICSVTLKLCCVLLLRSLMVVVTAPGEKQTAKGLALAFGLFLGNVADGICYSLATLHLQMTLYGMLSTVSQAVLWKGIVLHPALHDTNRRGALVTLAISDFQRIIDLSSVMMLGIGAPVMLLMAMIILIVIIGPVVLIEIVVVVAAVLVIGRVGKVQGYSFRCKMMAQGQRMGVLNEMLQSVRFTKFYMLEEHYERKMQESRSKELRWLWWMKSSLGMNWPVAACVPALTIVVIFSLHILLHGQLPSSPDTIAVLAIARFLFLPFAFFGGFLGCLNMLNSIMERLSALLILGEINRRPYPKNMELGDTDFKHIVAVSIENQSFTWSLPSALSSDLKSPTPELDSISLAVPQGELWAIVGELGSGKSTLLAAILGGVSPVGAGGGVTVTATSRTYVAQEPMVMNATVRDNIMFGSDLGAKSQDMYDLAIHAAALAPDLEVLPAGDLTEIGEKGLTLSGGQKARVALARAVFASQLGGLVLLDDPLAAVDAHVGAHIFEECVSGALAGTTRILVTNQLHFLQNPSVAQIVVMAEGRIVEKGSYEELATKGKGFFAKMLLSLGTNMSKTESKSSYSQIAKDHAAQRPTRRSFLLSDKSKDIETQVQGKLVKKENKREGAVTSSSFLFFFRCMGGNHVFVFCFFMAWSFHLTELLPDIWLVLWQDDVFEQEQNFYLFLWFAIVCGGIIMFVVERFCWIQTTMRATRSIHNKMLQRVLYCPIAFFDRTPSGRILNRLGEDQMLSDFTVAMNLEVLAVLCWQVADQVGMVLAAKPLVAPAGVLVVIVLLVMREVHRRSCRETMRWYLLTKSPVFSIFEEILSGANTIFAFGHEGFFAERFEQALLENIQWLMSRDACSTWLMQRTTMLGALFSGTLAVQMVLISDSGSSIFAGTALIYSLQLGITLQTLIYFFVQVEGIFASIERILEFTEEIPQEPPRHLPSDDEKVASAWPGQDFELELKEVSVRYGAHLPLALNKLSATILAREKVGIVGRTGCGKSTLFGALFRLFELETGRIIFGGEDIKRLGIAALRQKLTMVPQDPVLFSGDLRRNLDPLAACTDESLWQVLKQCSISDLVSGIDGGLNGKVSEGGSNFSVGERQVFCLARALLRNAPVLCLDEATANVDPTNDGRIQDVLSRQVTDFIVLTIAHRLHTVLKSDRIMVLDSGQLAQFDSPDSLLRMDGIFKELASQAGIKSSKPAPETGSTFESI